MNLIDLNMVALVLESLNAEMIYKINDNEANRPPTDSVIFLTTDGKNHMVSFMGDALWNSAQEEQLEDTMSRDHLDLNDKEHFETFIRQAVNFKIKEYDNVTL